MLKILKDKYLDCNKCEKCDTNKKVFGTGNEKAEIMIIGDNPGGMDIEKGFPFAGPPGELLNKILVAINLKRENLYLSNVTLCGASEKDRVPSLEEIQNCSLRLREEINIVKPNVILMVGSSSLKSFFGKDSKMSECHGRWFLDFEPPYARCFSIYHPSWVLHSVSEDEMKYKKRTVWEDLKKFSAELDVTNFTLIKEEDLEKTQ